jgi:hypothetical protein
VGRPVLREQGGPRGQSRLRIRSDQLGLRGAHPMRKRTRPIGRDLRRWERGRRRWLQRDLPDSSGLLVHGWHGPTNPSDCDLVCATGGGNISNFAGSQYEFCNLGTADWAHAAAYCSQRTYIKFIFLILKIKT